MEEERYKKFIEKILKLNSNRSYEDEENVTSYASSEVLIDSVCYHLSGMCEQNIGYIHCVEVGYSTYHDLSPVVRFTYGNVRVTLTIKQWVEFEKCLPQIIEWLFVSHDWTESLYTNLNLDQLKILDNYSRCDTLLDEDAECKEGTDIVYNMCSMEGSNEKFLKSITLQQQNRSFHMDRFNVLNIYNICSIINFRLNLMMSNNLNEFFNRAIRDAMAYMRDGEGELDFDNIYVAFIKVLNLHSLFNCRNNLHLREIYYNHPSYILRTAMNMYAVD